MHTYPLFRPNTVSSDSGPSHSGDDDQYQNAELAYDSHELQQPILYVVDWRSCQHLDTRYCPRRESFKPTYHLPKADAPLHHDFQIATQYGRSDVEVSLFTHSWAQPSIIARIPGSNPSAPRVLLGSHMDSINSANPSGRAPGADDDGTGTVNLLEAFRALLEGGFRPTATVEFQWYAAEEVGLRGSQAIATQYKNNGVQVAGHFQLDMTGYFTPGTKEVMALAPDYINAELNEFSKKIITEYAGIPWAMDRAVSTSVFLSLRASVVRRCIQGQSLTVFHFFFPVLLCLPIFSAATHALTTRASIALGSLPRTPLKPSQATTTPTFTRRLIQRV